MKDFLLIPIMLALFIRGFYAAKKMDELLQFISCHFYFAENGQAGTAEQPESDSSP